jgi:hypothetical protein
MTNSHPADSRSQRGPPTRARRDEIMTLWARQHRLKLTNGNHYWARLVGRRSTDDGSNVPQNLPGDDHCSLWNADGKPFCYVSQPYSLSTRDVAEMAEACASYGLDVQITTYPAWHYPGSVLFIVWTRRGERVFDRRADAGHNG